MRSRIEIVAEYRRGRTVVTRVDGGGHFAARRTGDGEMHLVGTAAGPLGGDDATIAVRLGPGARLSLRSAGATIIQPGLSAPGLSAPDSRLTIDLRVGDGAELDLATEPTVVCHAAEHLAMTSVELCGEGQVRLIEHVLLGRTAEPRGGWTGRLAVTRDGKPELRHTLRSSLLASASTTTRVISTLLLTGIDAQPATSGDAVAMPLAAGGLLVTATGETLLPVRADLLAAEAAARPARLGGTTISAGRSRRESASTPGFG
jgi:urease accessory protein